MPFQQMETINVFIDGCKRYRVSEKEMFVTLDLYERTNPNMVIAGLQALGRHITGQTYQACLKYKPSMH